MGETLGIICNLGGSKLVECVFLRFPLWGQGETTTLDDLQEEKQKKQNAEVAQKIILLTKLK